MKDSLRIILGVFLGILCIFASVFEWKWFFNSNKAQFLVKLLGKEGAKKFYLFLGIFIVAISSYLLFSKC